MNINKIIYEEIQKLNEISINIDKFGDALADVESAGGDYEAVNPKSSAVGKYQFLWNLHGNDIERITGVDSKENFLKNPNAQEKFFKHWFNTTLKPWATKLKPNSNKTDAELAALVHFQGPAGAKKYLESGAETRPDINLPVEKYLTRVKNSYYGTNVPQTGTDKNSSSPETDVLSRLEATPEEFEAELQKTKDKNALFDKIQLVADFLGFVPVIGDGIDFINGIVYFARGQYMSGTLSMIAVVPGIGSAIAMPLKVAFKSIGTIPPRVFQMLIKDPVGANTWWSKNVWSKIVGDKLNRATFKRFIDYGDDLLASIDKLSTTLRKKGFTDLANNTGDAGKYFRNMLDSGSKYYDELASGAKVKTSFGAAGNTTLQNTRAAAKVFANKIFSKKLITGLSKSNLNQLNKTFLTKFQNRVVNSRAFNELFDNFVRMNPAQQNQLNSFLQQLARQQGFGSVVLRNVDDTKNVISKLSSKSKKELIDFVLDNRNTFPDLYKAYTSRAGVFAAGEATRLRNILRAGGQGIRKFMFNVSEFKTLTANLSIPKIITKGAYVGAGLESMEFLPGWVREMGSSMNGFAIKLYRFFLPWIFDPNRELSEEELAQQRELEKEQERIERQFNRLQTYDAAELTPEQQARFYELLKVYEEQ